MNNINDYKIGFVDFIGAIVSGLLIGYQRQLLADSGQYDSGKVFVSMLIAGSSYLSAFLLFHRSRWFRVPSWVLISTFGSILCFFNLQIVKFNLDNGVFNLRHSVFGFFIITPIYSLVALMITGTIHSLGRWLVKCIFESNAVKLK